MNIATILFTYNRSYHTEQVIKSLEKNTVLPQKLFIFQDGVKKKEDKKEWEKVTSLINRVDWCEKEVIVSEYNKGLADSILSGINYVLEKFDAVIVLEDDCVPAINFMSFMNQCFEKYQNDKKVYSISGYSWPIPLKKQLYDVYGCGRISSWGWGTWKDRWKIYEKDYELVKKMKQKRETSLDLASWGMDLEDILVGNIKGYCDSWAVFWALNVISKQGICITPYYSLIKNIGMDGSGVHCGITDRYDVEYVDEGKDDFCFPEEINISDEVKKAFAVLHGSYTVINENAYNKIKVFIYGAGMFYLENEKQINEDYYIEGFVDENKKGFLEGKRIIKPEEIGECKFDKLLIMIRDKKECEKVVYLMKKYGVSDDKIEIGFRKYED